MRCLRWFYVREMRMTALLIAALMQKGTTVDLTINIAINASRLSLKYSLPMADSYNPFHSFSL
jgi:hypothetical protein